jgi:hypothetical protein
MTQQAGDERVASQNETARLIFQGKHVRIREALIGGDTCFVTFSSVGEKHTTGFGEAFLYKRAYSAIHLVTNWDHWYQPEEIRAAISLVNSLLIDGGFKKIIAYGASMGGYGAAAYSGIINATTVIIIAPQYSIAPQKVPFEKRWRREAEKLEFMYDDMPNQISMSAKKFYIYDPNSDDRYHIELYSRFPNTQLIQIPYSGHVPGHAILHAGLLQSLIEDLAADTFEHHAFRQAIHAGRRTSPVYWHALGAAAMKSNRLSTALHAIEQGLRLAPNDLPQQLLRANILLRCARYEDAIAYARELAERHPRHPACWRVLSIAAQQLKLPDCAVTAAQQAVVLRSHDADLHRVLLSALMKAGRYGEAAAEGRLTVRMDQEFVAPYIQTAEALRRIGDYAGSLELLQSAQPARKATPIQKKQLSDMEADIRRSLSVLNVAQASRDGNSA